MDRATLDTLIANLNEDNIRQAADGLLTDLKNGIPLKDAAHINPVMQEELYALGFDYYNQGKFPEAAIMFQVLSLVDPSSFRFMYGYASSHYMLKNFPEAIMGFYAAMALQPLNPMAAYYLSDCMIQLGAKKDAENILNVAIEICDEAKNGEYTTVKERCKLLKQSLKK